MLSRLLINLSSKPLDPSVVSALGKSLDPSVPSTALVREFVCGTEQVARELLERQTKGLHTKICHILMRERPIPNNFSGKERLAFNSLQKDSDVIMLLADKDNASIVLYTVSYTDKMQGCCFLK